MGLDHILLTTPSKSFLLVLFKVGAQGVLILVTVFHIGANLFDLRCTARAHDLDGEAGLQSQEHMEALVNLFDLKMLWEDYGIVGDVIVRVHVVKLVSCIELITSHSPHIFRELRFMSS